GTAAGIVVGGIGAVLLARRVKQTLYGLEPREIAQLFQERNAMLASVREGIIAINEKDRIVIANNAAKDLFHRAGLSGNPLDQPVESYLPSSALRQELPNQKAAYDQERQLNGIHIIVNIMPVVSGNEIVGTIATFLDKTEITSLAEQLTDAIAYDDTLRGLKTEFMNKMQVISSMIETESYEKLDAYITYISDNYQQEVGAVSRLVKDPVLAGYLLNKFNQFRNNGVTVELSGEQPLPILKNTKRME